MSFDDIRPYRDEEVRPTIERLLKNKQAISFARLVVGAPPWAGDLYIQMKLKREFRGVDSVQKFQSKIFPYVKRLIKTTTGGLTVSGLENLVRGQGYVYVTNHRDIALDSTFMNYALGTNNYDTALMLVGDNLLYVLWLEDFFRLTGSIIVKRHLPKKEQYEELVQLSHYIDSQIKEGHSIWMAQREGRAKDGNDATNPAVIKMLAISQRKKPVEFSEYINRIRILPVAISYEYNPCDYIMARELFFKDTRGSYKKKKREDVISMVRGIKEPKGRIHLAFGTPLAGEFSSAEDVAAAIDGQIHKNYQLWESNLVAFEELTREKVPQEISKEKREEFLDRVRELKPETQLYLLRMYARPLIKKLHKLNAEL